MIISFSVENFRSFAHEQTLSLVASNRYRGSHDNHLVSIPGTDESVLRTGLIYGANGAGKSNCIKAISFLKNLVVQPKVKGSSTGREVFRFQNDFFKKPTTLTLRFLTQGRIFEFGVKLNDQYILEEWLIELEGNRERPIYERVTTFEGEVTIEGKGLEGDKLIALAQVAGPPEQSFLATIRATLNQEDYGSAIGPVLNWLEVSLQIVSPDAIYRGLGLELTTNKDFLEFASAFLKGASTGVDKLEVRKSEITESELRIMLPEQTADRILNDAKTKGAALLPHKDQLEILLEWGEQGEFYTNSIGAMHTTESGEAVPLEIGQESDGTQRLLHLLPALYLLIKEGRVFFIDEIDRSMHPLLVWEFLKFFLDSSSGSHGQIIVTTHECNLLDNELLRRDEVWFSEKKAGGATALYSLSDFNPRNDLKLDRHYLQGRFGAVPFLGNLSRLIPQKEETLG